MRVQGLSLCSLADAILGMDHSMPKQQTLGVTDSDRFFGLWKFKANSSDPNKNGQNQCKNDIFGVILKTDVKDDQKM